MYIKLASIIEILLGLIMGGIGGFFFWVSSGVPAPESFGGFIMGMLMIPLSIFLIIFGINLRQLKKWAWLTSIVILIIVIALSIMLIRLHFPPILIPLILICVSAIICLILLILGIGQIFPIRETKEGLQKIQIEKKISIPWKKILIIAALIIAGVMGYCLYRNLQRPVPPVIPLEEKEEIPEIKALEGAGWTEPVSTQASGVEWSGVITLLDATNKIIKAKSETEVAITAFPLEDTVISDELGNALLLGDLKTGDVISISGEYQMRDKMTPNWEVRVHKTERITYLGKCIKEGEKAIRQCCLDLALIPKSRTKEEPGYCTKCGDFICKAPENSDNCPEDCPKEGIYTYIGVIGTIDFENNKFELRNSRVGKVVVLIDEFTKFYRGDVTERWEIKFSDLKEGYPFTSVKGTLLEKKEGEEIILRAQEVFLGIM